MKQNFLTRSLAVAIAAMMTFTGCYDDSDLQTRMDQAEADIAELQQLAIRFFTSYPKPLTITNCYCQMDGNTFLSLHCIIN